MITDPLSQLIDLLAQRAIDDYLRGLQEGLNTRIPRVLPLSETAA